MSREKNLSTNEECPLNPLDSARFVVDRAKSVSIDDSKIAALSKEISNAMMNGLVLNDDDQWIGSDVGPPKNRSDESTLDWLFFVTTLNFSFWVDGDSSDEQFDSYRRVYKDKVFFGFEGLCASINQAIENGIELTDARFYAKVELDQLEKIFNVAGDPYSVLPMLEERQRVLNETGSILLEQFGGHFINCLEQSGKSAIDLVQLVVDRFPSYRDETFYAGQKVSFYKRAQILVADIWGTFKGRSIGHLVDMDRLTMFADYRVPQVLCHEGVLLYSDRLKTRLAKKQLIEFGDPDEVEIRAASILSIEKIVNEVNESIPLERDIGDEGQRMNAVVVDVFLWRRRRAMKDVYKRTAFHRTRSIFY